MKKYRQTGRERDRGTRTGEVEERVKLKSGERGQRKGEGKERRESLRGR